MKKLAEYYKALADENRLKILQMLTEKEMCVCEIIAKLDISQPAISHHLKVLRQAGVVEDKREGKWIFYSLNKDQMANFDGELKKILHSETDVNSELAKTDYETCLKLEKLQK